MTSNFNTKVTEKGKTDQDEGEDQKVTKVKSVSIS